MPLIIYISLKMFSFMCVVSIPHSHGFQTIPHKNFCRAVCAEMFQNLNSDHQATFLVTIYFSIKTDEFCPLLTERWNTQLRKTRKVLSLLRILRRVRFDAMPAQKILRGDKLDFEENCLQPGCRLKRSPH